MYLCTNKDKNMTEITIRLMIPTFQIPILQPENVDQFHTKLEGALYRSNRTVRKETGDEGIESRIESVGDLFRN